MHPFVVVRAHNLNYKSTQNWVNNKDDIRNLQFIRSEIFGHSLLKSQSTANQQELIKSK